jgi:ribulose 1,5-bisphosphate carboxylase large subunit-like protein
VIQATYELDPPEWADELGRIESTGLAQGPDAIRARVVTTDGNRVVLAFPNRHLGQDVTLLVSALVAGEWADSSVIRRCRLVRVDWPSGLPGPAFEPPDRVLVGAIVKPSLGLSPAEFASTASALANGGVDLIKDDELLGADGRCPLEERVRATVAAIPSSTRYAANVSGRIDSLLQRAERAVELGASALMLNVFAQGLDALRLLREQEFGVPIFAHRVGAAYWCRSERASVASDVVAELTRLCGADFVQVGSFSGTVYDSEEQVKAQIDACHRRLGSAHRSVAVLGGGVGPANAAEHLVKAGCNRAVMLLLGSAAYAHPGGVEEGVRATLEAIR